MKCTGHLLAIAGAIALSSGSSSAADELEYMDMSEPPPIAVYTAASSGVRRELRVLVHRICRSTHGMPTTLYEGSTQNDKAVVAPWLCVDQHLLVLQGINIAGKKVRSGYICSEDEDGVGFRLNPTDYFEGTQCIPFISDAMTGDLKMLIEET